MPFVRLEIRLVDQIIQHSIRHLINRSKPFYLKQITTYPIPKLIHRTPDIVEKHHSPSLLQKISSLVNNLFRFFLKSLRILLSADSAQYLARNRILVPLYVAVIRVMHHFLPHRRALQQIFNTLPALRISLPHRTRPQVRILMDGCFRVQSCTRQINLTIHRPAVYRSLRRLHKLNMIRNLQIMLFENHIVPCSVLPSAGRGFGGIRDTRIAKRAKQPTCFHWREIATCHRINPLPRTNIPKLSRD